MARRTLFLFGIVTFAALLTQNALAQAAGSGDKPAVPEKKDQPPTYVLNSKTVDQWTATDGSPLAESGGRITMPAGAQLSRKFATGAIEVRVVSRPVFNEVPADWAGLELGPVSLTFVRKADGGGIVLLGDERLALPFALSLDQEHRSRDSLELALAFNPVTGTATFTVQKTVFDLAATATAGSVELALSAGRAKSWTLDLLEVRTSDTSGADARSASGSPAGVQGIVALADRINARKEGLARAKTFFDAGADIEGEKALIDSNRNPKNSAEWYLETANQLVQTAFSFTRAGKPQRAVQIAQRALDHAEKASRKASREAALAPLAAAAEELSAHIQEKLLADYAGAKVFYQKAALRYPQGDAAGQVKRLERIDREGRRRAGEAVAEPDAPPPVGDGAVDLVVSAPAVEEAQVTEVQP